MSTSDSKIISEFLTEAQELVELLSNNLLEIDSFLKDKIEPDSGVINEVFRGWHTLKGLSSTVGADALLNLAHREENLLDDMRLGRVDLTDNVLDSLFGSLDTVMEILGRISQTGDLASSSATELITSPKRESNLPTIIPEPIKSSNDLDEKKIDLKKLFSVKLLEVLTEFEEYRLLTNLRRGNALYKVKTSFLITSIDTDLDSIKEILKPLGEIITYLPSDENSNTEMLDIDILLALSDDFKALEIAVTNKNAKLELLVPQKIAFLDNNLSIEETKSPLQKDTDASVPTYSSNEISRSQFQDTAMAAIDAKTTDAKAIDGGAMDSGVIDNKAIESSISLRSVSQSVRVDIEKLDGLMNSVGELNLIRNAVAKVSEKLRTVGEHKKLSIELSRIMRDFERRLADMREGILEVRMVSLGQTFDRLARITRKISRDLNKDIQLIVSGADTEVDKLIIEELSDPLMHIIRNCIDHGIEDMDTRLTSGKPKTGTVALTAYPKGSHVLVEIEDDGAGINGDSIVKSAIANGKITIEQSQLLTDREILNLIFLPGITTTSETTEISGRGIGMDVVKTNISSLGGLVEVQSELGIGTKFTIIMPVTLAIIPALLVAMDNNTYAIPLNTVAEILTPSALDIRKVMQTETVTLRGKTLPLGRLDIFFDMPRFGHIADSSRIVVAALGQHRLGIIVDSLLGQQDVIIKPLGKSVREAGCFSGVTDIGDNKLALVLDTVFLIEEFFASNDKTQKRSVFWE